MNDLTPRQTDSLSHHHERLSLARSDRRELSSLIRDYTPFIKKCVSTVMFGSQSKEDNLTEAMLAFAHSVQTYKEDFGSFIAYARTGALM